MIELGAAGIPDSSISTDSAERLEAFRELQRTYRNPTLVSSGPVIDLTCFRPSRWEYAHSEVEEIKRGPFRVFTKRSLVHAAPPVTSIEIFWWGTKPVAGHVFPRFHEVLLEGHWTPIDLFPAQDLIVLASDGAVRFLSLATGRPRDGLAGLGGDIEIPRSSCLTAVYGNWFLLVEQQDRTAKVHLFHWPSRHIYHVSPCHVSSPRSVPVEYPCVSELDIQRV